jgi:hypothetical protein
MSQTSHVIYAEKIPDVGQISTIDQAAPPEHVNIMALERGFQEISVTRLGFQTAAQRVSFVEHRIQSAKLLRALGSVFKTTTDIT